MERNRARGVVILVAVVAMAGFGSVRAQLRERIEAAGVELPEPWGVTLTLYTQDEDYTISHLALQLPGIDPTMANGLPITNKTNTQQLQLDYWLQPYLNVFGFVGNVKGTTRVWTQKLDLGLPFSLDNIRIHYTGIVYGGGATLAGGWKHAFGSATFEYTDTDLNVSSSSISAWVGTVKVGYQTEGLSVWVGTMYQDTDEKDKGMFSIPYFGAFPFEVEFKPKSYWNYQVGVQMDFSKHWNLVLEGGFSGRKSLMASLAYRF